jgi:hypothetical protein
MRIAYTGGTMHMATKTEAMHDGGRKVLIRAFSALRPSTSASRA